MDYNLKINDMRKLTVSSSMDGSYSMSNVITHVDYTICCTGSNNATSSYHLETSACNVGTVESSSFIGYNDLTEGIVKSWITGSSDWSEKLSNAEAQLSSSMWPEESNGLPW